MEFEHQNKGTRWDARDRSLPTSCEVQNSVMIVKGTLNSTHLGSFSGCLTELVKEKMNNITIDFTRCRYLSSMFIGYLVDAILKAQEDGKQVDVYVSPEIGRFLRMAQLHQLFSFHVTDPLKSDLLPGVRC